MSSTETPAKASARQPWIPFAHEYDRQRLVGVVPTDDFIFEVRRALEETGAEPAQMAQWIADRMEELGNERARPTFDTDGSGPFCSWCGALAMLCGHGGGQ